MLEQSKVQLYPLIANLSVTTVVLYLLSFRGEVKCENACLPPWAQNLWKENAYQWAGEGHSNSIPAVVIDSNSIKNVFIITINYHLNFVRNLTWLFFICVNVIMMSHLKCILSHLFKTESENWSDFCSLLVLAAMS